MDFFIHDENEKDVYTILEKIPYIFHTDSHYFHDQKNVIEKFLEKQRKWLFAFSRCSYPRFILYWIYYVANVKIVHLNGIKHQSHRAMQIMMNFEFRKLWFASCLLKHNILPSVTLTFSHFIFNKPFIFQTKK